MHCTVSETAFAKYFLCDYNWRQSVLSFPFHMLHRLIRARFMHAGETYDQ